jgi:segregation and condensation protein B
MSDHPRPVGSTHVEDAEETADQQPDPQVDARDASDAARDAPALSSGPEASPDDPPAEGASAEDSSAEDASAEGASAEDASAEDASAEDASAEGLPQPEKRSEAPEAAVTDEPQAPAPPSEPDVDALRLAEALIFASPVPVTPSALARLLPDEIDADAVIAELEAHYAGRGVELVQVSGGLQFRTAPDLAPKLRRVIDAPRRLPRVAMETLAIIAYHQPVTRPEIEEIRGASLSQQTVDALLEANLVTPKGRRDSPGRPTLWGTTQHFLTQFGLQDLRDLPRRDDLLVEPPQPAAADKAESDAGAASSAEDADGQPEAQQPDDDAPQSDQAASDTEVTHPPAEEPK